MKVFLREYVMPRIVAAAFLGYWILLLALGACSSAPPYVTSETVWSPRGNPVKVERTAGWQELPPMPVVTPASLER